MKNISLTTFSIMSRPKILILIQMCPFLFSNICFYILFLCSVWHRYISIAHYIFYNNLRLIFFFFRFEHRALAKVKYSIKGKILSIEFLDFMRFIFEAFSYLYPYWPWSTEWSRAKANRVLQREYTGHSKPFLPTTQEKALHMDIARWSTPKSDWL